MKKMGQVGKLKIDKINEYIKLHESVWEDVLKKISECNLSNYSIFIKGDFVFSYFEYTGLNYEEDMQKMADDSVTQEWWELTKPCFEKLTSESLEAFYEDMDKIFDYN